MLFVVKNISKRNAAALHDSKLQNVSYLVAPVRKVHCNALRPRSLERLLVMNV